MKKGNKYILSAIFLFSIFLIGLGLFISIQDRLEESTNNNSSIPDKLDIVNVTKNGKDKKPLNDSSTKNNNTDDNTSNTPNTNNNNNNSGNGSKDPVPLVPVPNPTPEAQPSTEPTIDEVNNNLRVELQNKYGVTIKYGSETSGYSVGGMSTSIISDPSKVNKALSELSANIANYPKGFFKEFNSIGLHLTIYLIDTYSVSEVTGVTDPSSNNVIISIATYYPFNESFNHETYHYMERYIRIKGGAFTSWQQYNPSGFKYGSLNSNLSFDITKSVNSYFVNDYAQTDEYEDRASTFEYMMADTKQSCMGYNLPIWSKANYMSKVIDVYFSTVNSSTTEYWERFL